MNNDLACGNSYTKLDQKSVTAWLDLRNRAAHGRYGDSTRRTEKGRLLEARDRAGTAPLTSALMA